MNPRLLLLFIPAVLLVAAVTPLKDAKFTGAPDFSAATNKSTVRSDLGLAIGSDVQAYDADLATWADITPGVGVASAAAQPVNASGGFLAYDGTVVTAAAMGILQQLDYVTMRAQLGAAALRGPFTLGDDSLTGDGTDVTAHGHLIMPADKELRQNGLVVAKNGVVRLYSALVGALPGGTDGDIILVTDASGGAAICAYVSGNWINVRTGAAVE
jgi:hypothetical protein